MPDGITVARILAEMKENKYVSAFGNKGPVIHFLYDEEKDPGQVWPVYYKPIAHSHPASTELQKAFTF